MSGFKPGSTVLGVIFGAVAAAAYGVNPLFALPMYKEGLSTSCVLFHRYTIALVLLSLYLYRQRVNVKIPARSVLPVLFCGVMMFVSSNALFLSYRYMAAAVASTMLFVYPVMVAVIMAVFFHEKITLSTGIGIAGSLAGVVILYQGGGNQTTLSLAGVIWVMVSSLSYAFYIIAVRESRAGKIAPPLLNFYVLAVGALGFFVQMLFTGWQWLPSLFSLGCAVALGVIPTLISFLCTTLASRYIGPTKCAILGALEPATGVCVGVLVFGEEMTLRLAFGIVLILAAVTVVVSGKQSEALNRYPVRRKLKTFWKNLRRRRA